MSPASGPGGTGPRGLVDLRFLRLLRGVLVVAVINARRLPPFVDWEHPVLRDRIQRAISAADASIIFDATEQLIRDCIAAGWSVRKLHLYDCFRATGTDPQKYWKKKARYNLRRSRAQLEQDGTLAMRVSEGRDISPESFERFAELLSLAASDERRIDSKWSREAHRALFREVVSAPGSLVFELVAADRVIAVAHCNIVGRSLVYMVPTYDAEFSRFSPGMLLLLEISNYCGANGLVLDLGKGEADYKSRMAGESYPLHVAVLSRSGKGRVISLGAWWAMRLLVLSSRATKHCMRLLGR